MNIPKFTIPYTNFLVALLLLSVSGFAQSTPQNAEAKIISSQEFLLSDAATRAGIDGKMRIGLTVDKTGTVKNIIIYSGPAWPCGSNPKKDLDDVRNAVKQNLLTTRFSPAIKNGKPFDSDLILNFIIGNAYRQAVKQREAEEAVKSGAVLPKLIDSGVLNGKALSLPKPEYPSSARTQRISGAVPVEILIDEKGRVVLVGSLGGHPLLQASARDSACGARFSPTVLKGQPVKVTGVITYNFVP
jgi:TonB family protein